MYRLHSIPVIWDATVWHLCLLSSEALPPDISLTALALTSAQTVMMQMIAVLLMVFLTEQAVACSDSYPIPSSGGQYCDMVSAIGDGQNCWGDCVTGCPTLHCPAGVTPCYMETRDISTSGSCIWPANTKLCCAHAGSSGHYGLTEDKVDFGFIVNSTTSKTTLDAGVPFKSGTKQTTAVEAAMP